jgi:demethylmenaquinone methyltransferase/2-methoxy-6-polyprenyl-1,4-benzoquinol methylase
MYDAMSQLYSGGQIRVCKLAFLDQIRPGQRVLFAGAGTGEDAIAAAERGATVVAIDSSAEMVERLRERAGPGTAIEIVRADVLEVDRPGQFDWVISNFFLNIFQPEALRRVIGHLAAFMTHDGALVIGDFAPPVAGRVQRALQALHYYLPVAVFRLLTGTPLHRLHDYRNHLLGAGLELRETRRYRALRWGPRWYAALLVTRLTSR